MSWIMSGVNVPSDVTDDDADMSLCFGRRTWDNDVDDVPIDAVVVDLRKKLHSVHFFITKMIKV